MRPGILTYRFQSLFNYFGEPQPSPYANETRLSQPRPLVLMNVNWIVGVGQVIGLLKEINVTLGLKGNSTQIFF